MRIGIPKESKVAEGRIALIPAACADLVRAGHQVVVQTQAGSLSGYSDEAYQAAGAEIAGSMRQLYAQTELIVKVKEPVDEELDLLEARHVLFSYLHLAANRELAGRLAQIGLAAIAFETVEEHGSLPLLAPMSQIAGRVAAQIGTTLLYQYQGGSGVLLGGVATSARGSVVVLGAGQAGTAAIQVAAGLGANVTVFDKKWEKLEQIRNLGSNITTLYPYKDAVHESLAGADLVIGAVLIPGSRAPVVVTEKMVADMPDGSVIVDISVDQGGCIATTRPTTYAQPTYKEFGVCHFAVTNIPGAVPRTASQALSAVLLPYVQLVAAGNWQSVESLSKGLNVQSGRVVHPVVREALV